MVPLKEHTYLVADDSDARGFCESMPHPPLTVSLVASFGFCLVNYCLMLVI